MSDINQKYLKDKDNGKFSPIVSANSVFMEDGTLITECIPKLYRFDYSSLATTLTVFSGNLPDWTLFTLYANIQTASNSSKAVYLRINGQSNSGYDFIDARYRDGSTKYYNPISSGSFMFIGDVAYSGNTSYLEVTVFNRKITNWNTLKSVIGNATKTSDDFSISSCSGQFNQSMPSLTKIELNATATIRATGIIEVYV